MNALSDSLAIFSGTVALSCGSIANAIGRYEGDVAVTTGIILIVLGGWRSYVMPLWNAIAADGLKQSGALGDKPDANNQS